MEREEEVPRALELRLKPIEEACLADRYIARNRALYGETFYEGIIDIEGIRIELEKAKKTWKTWRGS